MSESKFLILLNDRLKKHIITLNQGEKKRLQEKFEFLENGIWDSGLRVKKLKGISEKVIFEARLTKGDRLIFTLGRHAGITALYIWGISKHDDVNKQASSILPENAPFLSFAPEYQEEYPELLIDDLDARYFTQENIDEKSYDDYGPQKWLVLTDDQWKRLLLSDDPDNFEIFLYLSQEQENVLEKRPPLLLSGTAGSGKTTISVYYLLRPGLIEKRCLFLTYSPYLKEFSEKIYNGLITKTDRALSGGKTDFLTFHDLLKEILKKSGTEYPPEKEVGLSEFVAIFMSHKYAKKYDPELVWEEIRSIIKGAKPPINIHRYRRLLKIYLKQEEVTRNELNELRDYLYALKNLEFISKIERLISKKTIYTSYDNFILSLSGNTPYINDHALVLNELLTILEHRLKNISDPLLTFQEYMLLGKKRAPNFLYNREDIYSIAEYYQKRLQEQGLYDEIDLCKEALRQFDKTGDNFIYDFVVCDEVQDFSDLQIFLIFRLVKSYENILFTGDPKQIINPSGFRWEEVKNRFYERGIQVPEVHKLNLNFRCVGNIVKLSNALLDLKQKFVGLTDAEMKEDWKFNGRPPYLLFGMNEKQIYKEINLTGAGQIILVRNKEEQSRLKRILKTELIFTINEAKGLEFDTVFLWKFIIDKKSADIWRKIKNDHAIEKDHVPHIRHEINLLYVATTRARNTFIMYDGEHYSDVWGLDIFNDIIYKTEEPNVLNQVWKRVSTPEEWETQGDYFFDRRRYSAALECYKNAGNAARTEIAQAFDYEEKKRYKLSAELFARHGYQEKAAENYEYIGEYKLALDLWRQLKNQKRMQICRIKLHEEAADYNKAAEEWLHINNYENALKNWIKAKNNVKIGEYYYSRKQYTTSAEYYEKAKEYNQAALCMEKAKKINAAADLYYKGRDFKKAASLYKKLKNTLKLKECYLMLEDHYNCALLYEKEKDFENAVERFRAYSEGSDSNRAALLDKARELDKQSTQIKAALRYAALGIHEKSAPVFLKRKQYNLAVKGYREIGAHDKAAECFLFLRDYYHAALEYEKSQIENKWEVARVSFERYLSLRDRSKIGKFDELKSEAQKLKKSGSYDQALVRFKALYITEEIEEIYLKNLDRHEEAIGYYLNTNQFPVALRYLTDKKDIDFSIDFLKKLGTNYSTKRWYWGDEQKFEVINQIYQIFYLAHKDMPESLKVIDDFVGSMPNYFSVLYTLPRSFYDFVLEIKHYNTVINIISEYTLLYARNKKIPLHIKNFIEMTQEKGEADKDKTLLACSYFSHDRNEYERLLKEIEITERNINMFEASTKSYVKAVNFYLTRGKTEEAIRVYRHKKDYYMAGKLNESSNNLKDAAKDYYEGRHYKEAMSVFKTIGDEVGMARVYERTKEFDKALAIWKKRGRKRDYERVLTKKARKNASDRQLKLLKPDKSV